MNKIILICLFSVLFLSSCGSSASEEEISKVKKSVESVESILGRYDNNVQSAVDSHNFKYIHVVAQQALDSTNIILDKLKITSEAAYNKELVSTAITYIELLRELMIIDESYAKLSDGLSMGDAKQLDDNFYQTSQKAQQAYSEYSTLLKGLPAQ